MDFHMFPIGFRFCHGPLASSWPLDPPGPPWEPSWPETNKEPQYLLPYLEVPYGLALFLPTLQKRKTAWVVTKCNQAVFQVEIKAESFFRPQHKLTSPGVILVSLGPHTALI